jgi:hypothetical protein
MPTTLLGLSEKVHQLSTSYTKSPKYWKNWNYPERHLLHLELSPEMTTLQISLIMESRETFCYQSEGATVLDLVEACCRRLKVPRNTFERACINFHEDLVPKDESAKVVLMEQVNFAKANWEGNCVFFKAKIIPGELEPEECYV